MAKIGNWGKVVTFSVTAKKVLTFTNMKREVSGRWAFHNILNKKPKGEFTGPGSATTTLDVTLSAEHGVKPRNIINKLEKAAEKGQVEYLYIGGKKIGNKKVGIESLSESWDEVWSKGELVRAKITIKFIEY